MPQEMPNSNKVEKETYSEEVVRYIVKKFRERSWEKVLMEESIGGNAGSNKAAINAYIEKNTGKIIMFGNFQSLPKEIVSNSDYTSATFLYDYGNFFKIASNENLEVDPAFFEKVSAPGASKQALENLKEALIRFDREYVELQMKKSKKH